MSNEARSYSHRWLWSPDRIAVIGGVPTIVRGSLIRQRLSTTVKPGWRAVTWGDLDPSDPSTKEALDYKREQDAKSPAPAVQRMSVFRDGVPDPGQPAIVTPLDETNDEEI